MKRMIPAGIAAMLAAVLLVAPAEAGVKQFSGSVTGGGKVTFDVRFKKGKPKLAGPVEFRRIPVECDERDTKVRFSYSGTVNVRNRKFSYTFSSFTASFNGKLNRKGKKASGKLDYGPSDLQESGLHNCSTDGPRKWKATR